MKKAVAVLYLLGIHVLLAVVLLKSDFIQRVEAKLARERKEFPGVTEHYRNMLLYHSLVDGNVPEGALLFIGDSITQALCVCAVAPSSVNYGIGGDTSAGVLYRLPTYESMARAGAIVLAVGVNDMRRRRNEEILRNYRAAISQIPEHVPLIISGVLPIDEAEAAERYGSLKRIADLNADLRELTRESDRCHFLDSGPELLDASGNLADEYHIGDGLHLNGEGYSVWIRELQRSIAEAAPHVQLTE